MLDSGIPKATIMAWTKDPQVLFEGKKASLFDLLEDLDYDECLAKAQAIAGVKGKRPAGEMKSGNLVKFGGGFYAGKIPAPSKAPTKLQRRRTSGDMSVFSSGESVMDAVLSQEGGKML